MQIFTILVQNNLQSRIQLYRLSFITQKLLEFFEGRQPVIVAKDLDFRRQITIQDFEHFEEHTGYVESEAEALIGKSFFFSWMERNGIT